MREALPKVLVVTINAWKDNTGINTLINFFRHWDTDRVAQIYTRSELPATNVCNEFFQISENAVVKSVLKRNINTGRRVNNCFERVDEKDVNNSEEKKKYSFFRKHRSEFFEFCREAAWRMGKWKTKELNEFLDNCDADILFMPIYAYSYMGNLQSYIIERLNKPVITYIADDVYFYKQIKGNPMFYINRYFQRRAVKRVMKHNRKLFVIAPKLKKVFDKEFSTDSSILAKGIDFSKFMFEEKSINNPIRLVYTGKTNIGRWKSLAMIGRAIKKINANDKKMELFIYTKEELTDKVKSALNIEGASRVMGGISMDEVMKVQKEADIVVFAECLEKKYKDIAWLSFSTKLTDYMANGKCILAVGADDIAPIEYLKENDAALTASSENEIYNILKNITNNPKIINEYAKAAYECGVRNHDEKAVGKTFREEIVKVYRLASDNY